MPRLTQPLISASRSTRRHRHAGCGRTVLRRILFIHECLGNHHRATAVSLARELEVSERTIKRDVEFMRDQLGAPIEWDASTGTYHYSRKCDILPLLRLDAGEALALALAGRTFAAWHGSPLGRSLTTALGKITGVIGGAVSLPVSEISHLVFQPEDDADADGEFRHFATMLEAIRRRRILRISYRKPGARSDEIRSIHPLHLAHLDHRWVLVAYDPARRAPRNFLLARIHEARPAAASFSPPPAFDLRTYLRGSLGRFTGNREIEVRIAFDAAITPYVRERPWHPSQVVVDRAGGGIEVTLRLNNLIDVQRRVLACGSHAEVLAPAELRDAVRTEASAMAALYAPQRL